MKSKLLSMVVGVGALLWAGQSYAAFLANGSSISISGSDQYTATSISFVNPANVGGVSGSFTALGTCNTAADNGCATMTSFSTATATPFQMYTATHNGLTTTLQVATDSFSFSAVGPSLTVTGTGTLTLTGFDATPGTYILTTQGPTGATTVTFSVTSTAVIPEPASMAIFGAALAGLGLIRRRRKTA